MKDHILRDMKREMTNTSLCEGIEDKINSALEELEEALED